MGCQQQHPGAAQYLSTHSLVSTFQTVKKPPTAPAARNLPQGDQAATLTGWGGREGRKSVGARQWELPQKTRLNAGRSPGRPRVAPHLADEVIGESADVAPGAPLVQLHGRVHGNSQQLRTQPQPVTMGTTTAGERLPLLNIPHSHPSFIQ